MVAKRQCSSKAAGMFKNTFQSGFLSILYSIGSKPLQIWEKKVNLERKYSERFGCVSDEHHDRVWPPVLRMLQSQYCCRYRWELVRYCPKVGPFCSIDFPGNCSNECQYLIFLLQRNYDCDMCLMEVASSPESEHKTLSLWNYLFVALYTLQDMYSLRRFLMHVSLCWFSD